MSSVVIAGDTSGTVTLSAPATAGSTTLTLPATSGTLLQSGTAVTVAQGGTGLTTAGTSGNVLTSDGTNWASTAPGGMTSLGTITLSGTANQFSLGSLTLTSYKYLYCVVKGLGSTTAPGFNVSLSNATGDQYAATGITAGASIYFYGVLQIDLTSGLLLAQGSGASGIVSTTSSATAFPMPLATVYTSGYSWYGPTAIGTATTTMYLYITSAGTKSGTVTVYGVK